MADDSDSSSSENNNVEQNKSELLAHFQVTSAKNKSHKHKPTGSLILITHPLLFKTVDVRSISRRFKTLMTSQTWIVRLGSIYGTSCTLRCRSYEGVRVAVCSVGSYGT